MEKRRELDPLPNITNEPRDVRLDLETILEGRVGWRFPAIYIGDEVYDAIHSRWTSQVGQDKTVVEIFHGKRGGYFVDLAANDAVVLSNTLTLEQEFGWSGLCVEPNHEHMHGLLHRRCQVVVGLTGRHNNEMVPFKLSGVFSGVVGDRFDNKAASDVEVTHMKTVTVEKVFADFGVPPVVDYLSLDVEGAEMWIFEHFPWHRHTFMVITVERPKELTLVLERHGYAYVRDHGTFGDQLWVHHTLPNLDEVMARFKGTTG